MSKGVVVVAALALAAFVAYWPSLHGGFVWDDATYVQDRLIKASDGLYRMWFTTDAVDYWPLTNTTFWFEWRLWGLHSSGYHVTNLLLHIGNAVIFWSILRRLAVPGAIAASVIFLLHPVNVESVAWIAQRKNTLSTLFFLLSILWYVRSDEARGERRWYWLSLAAFLLAMLSKASIATLPLLLLVIVWWRRDVITRMDLLRVVPFVGIAAALTAVNLWFRTHGSDAPLRDVTV